MVFRKYFPIFAKNINKMSTATATVESKPKPARQVPRKVTKEHFLRHYSNREDGYKYEWNDGIIEKTQTMNQRQSKFFYILLKLFLKTNAAENGGMMVMETDMDTSPVQLRRPDMAFFTVEQLPKMWAGENQVAPWVVEVISPTDRADDINAKLYEYFLAGVQVVWHIFPQLKKVDVFTAPEKVTICSGMTVCSGAPALPDLQISAEELFS